MSDKLAEGLAELDKTLGIEADPEEEVTPSADEAPVEEAVTAETEEPEAEPEPTEEEHLLAGRFKTPEELERGYEELRSRMGEQSGELGELRKLLDERLPEREEEQYAPIDQARVDWFDEQIDQNPYAAAEWARQNQPELLGRALQAWAEIPGQGIQAANYLVDLRMQDVEARLSERTQPLQEQAQQQMIQQAWVTASAEIPDMNEYADQIVAEANESPEILREADTLEKKVKAYKKLYKMARGAQASTVESASAENAEAQAAENKAAKLSGASTSQTKAVVAETVSDDEKWLQENLDPHLAPFMARD